MYYIGLDVHKKTISYFVKDAAGQVYREGKTGSTRCELDSWIKLFSTNEEISDGIRPLLRLGREHTLRGQRLDRALISSLEHDPLLSERLRRLRTIPGVGLITALTWALEIGDYTRFRSVKEAISYCGLCSAEKKSADKVMRMPISKQRNKHIQHVLVEAAIDHAGLNQHVSCTIMSYSSQTPDMLVQFIPHRAPEIPSSQT